MNDFDLFDLTGLPFDPPEKAAKKVKAAIEKKVKELGSLLGSETQQVKRDEMGEQLKFLDDILKSIFSGDGKKLVEAEYMPLAEKRVQSELSKLQSTVKLMALTGNLEITEATVKALRKERRLSEEHVNDTFAALGFTIKKYDGIDIASLLPKQIKKVEECVTTLSKTKDPNPNGPDTSLVTDLYSFAAYLMGEPENAALYHSKTTSDLLGIFDSFAKKFSQRNDNLGKLCATLATLAKTNVFSSDKERQLYEFYLKYSSSKLRELFESMRGAPKQVLLDPAFAEPCIKKISEALDDSYDVALAVYNKEAGVNYIPPRSIYYIKCNYCGVVNEFASEAEAIKSNRCSNCRKELFKKCSKCGNMTHVAKEKCPHCGFLFAGAAMFGKYFNAAEEALRRSDFEAARKNLFDAQSADPSEKQRIDQLSAKIESEEKRYKKPLNELRQLMSAKRFAEAQSLLPKIIQEYPNLNIADYEAQIKSVISKANSRFTAARALSPSKLADECISILNDCVDHRDALNFLHTTPPTSCKRLNVIPDTAKGCINISWDNSTERGIRYHLVRKAGHQPPITVSDGTLLMADESCTQFCDETASPGHLYTYGLFVSRHGIFSAAVSEETALYSDVQNLRITQSKGTVRLTWDDPQNSMGAIVSRNSAGKNTILTQAAYGGYEDCEIKYGTPYTYTVQVNYGNSQKSPGATNVITPMLIVDSFRIKATQVKENIYKVTWDIRQPGINLRVMVDKALASECKSDDGSVQVALPKEKFSIITVMAYSGGTWISSENEVHANTYSACAIDKNETELREDVITTPQGLVYSIDLKIRIAGTIPNNVVGFYYAVRTASAATRWGSVDDIGKAPDIYRVSIKEYRAKGGIVYSSSVKEEKTFYISMFTIYEFGGKEIISEPKALKLDRPISADLFWKVTKSLFGSLKLTVSVEGNRPIDHIPELVLCACYDSEFITSYNDPKAIELIRVPSIDLESAQSHYSQNYDIDKSGYNKSYKYFLFEVNPVRSEKFTLRWLQGFSGKVR